MHAQYAITQAAETIGQVAHASAIASERVLNTMQGLAAAPAIAPAFTPSLPLTPTRVWVETVPLPEPAPQTKERSWLEQQRRNIKAWQLKQQRAQLAILRQAIAALPQLRVESAFQATDLTPYRIEQISTQQMPPLPALTRPGYLYRGLGLSAQGEEMRNIFQNGLRICDVGRNSNCLLLAMSSSAHSAAAVTSIKYTNLTKKPKLALDYALRNSRYVENGIPAIVIVTGSEDNGKIVQQVTHDIPADHIEGMLVLMNIEDKPTWCLVQLQEEHFVITPYETKTSD